jgi:pimeloyl-ACP methyl ester carboxylesterase
MMFLNLPDIKSSAVPLLIIGGEEDFLIRKQALQKNAQQLGAVLVMMKGGHNINLENGWELVAQRIHIFFNA